MFTSYHNICYLSDFLYCYFGRKYGLVVTQDKATSVTAAIDGGQPARRTFGDNVTYTDWSKDNYFIALKGLIKGVKRVGIEFDHVSLDFRKMLEDAFPASSSSIAPPRRSACAGSNRTRRSNTSPR